MITLYQFPAKRGVPNLSHFCMKLEGWLKMTGLEFTVREVIDPRKTPKGKAPFIKDEDGTIVADSSLVIDYLIDKYQVSLDNNLTALQRAQSIALQRLMEDHLYWVVVYSRWVDQSSWPTIADTWFGDLPFPANKIAPIVAQRDVKQNLHRHGIGRHEPAEIYTLGKQDIDALAAILEKQPYLLGDSPQGIDASGMAWLANFLLPDLPENPLTQHCEQYPQFSDYVQRMRDQYWKDDPRFGS